MTARRRILHGLIFAGVIALPIAQGCGGDDAAVGGSTSDAGGGSDTSTSGGDDGSTPITDGSTPLDSATGTDAFCSAAAAYASRCALTDACTTAKVAACTSAEAIASAGGIAAYEACTPIEPCPGATPSGDGGGAKAYDDCLVSHYGSPSATAETLATDYCSRCLPAVGACSTGFYDSKSPSIRFLALNDATLEEIDKKCLSKDGGVEMGPGCANDFTKCARDVVDAHDPPPAACKDQ